MDKKRLNELSKKVVLLKIKKKSLDTQSELRKLKKEIAQEMRAQNNGK